MAPHYACPELWGLSEWVNGATGPLEHPQEVEEQLDLGSHNLPGLDTHIPNAVRVL